MLRAVGLTIWVKGSYQLGNSEAGATGAGKMGLKRNLVFQESRGR